MPAAELPDEPVVAWREVHSSWWATLLGVGLLAGGTLGGVGERHREVTISVNGIRADNRFIRWDEVEGIIEADDPDLASISLTDRSAARLDRWHLPADPGVLPSAKRERLDLLRRAFETSRAAEP